MGDAGKIIAGHFVDLQLETLRLPLFLWAELLIELQEAKYPADFAFRRDRSLSSNRLGNLSAPQKPCRRINAAV